MNILNETAYDYIIDRAWMVVAACALLCWGLTLLFSTIYNVYPRIYDNDPCNIYYRAKHNYDKLKELGKEDQALSIQVYKDKWEKYGISVDDVTSDNITPDMCKLEKKERQRIYRDLDVEVEPIDQNQRYSVRNMFGAGTRSLEGTFYNLVRIGIPVVAFLLANLIIESLDDDETPVFDKYVVSMVIMAVTYIFTSTSITLHDSIIGSQFIKGMYIDVVFAIVVLLYLMKIVNNKKIGLKDIDFKGNIDLTGPGYTEPLGAKKLLGGRK